MINGGIKIKNKNKEINKLGQGSKELDEILKGYTGSPVFTSRQSVRPTEDGEAWINRNSCHNDLATSLYYIDSVTAGS